MRDRSRCIGLVDPRSAKWPARAGRHVDTEIEALRFPQRVAEHRHPGFRQEGNEPGLFSADAVDRRDLHAADAGVAKRFELGRQVLRDRPRFRATTSGSMVSFLV